MQDNIAISRTRFSLYYHTIPTIGVSSVLHGVSHKKQKENIERKSRESGLEFESNRFNWFRAQVQFKQPMVLFLIFLIKMET